MEVGSAENARSNFQPTTTDGGSAENAGAVFCPSIHGHKKALRRGLTIKAFIIILSNNTSLEVKVNLRTQDIN